MPVKGVLIMVLIIVSTVLCIPLYNALAPMGGDYSQTTTVSYTSVVDVDVDVPVSEDTHVSRFGFESRMERFVMPDDPAVRQVAAAIMEDVDDASDLRELARIARNWVGFNIDYRSDQDAHGHAEWWQLPCETLRLGAGDCEDRTLLFVSICEAMGIDTVLVKEPDHLSAAVKVPARTYDDTVEWEGETYVTADPGSAYIGSNDPDVLFLVDTDFNWTTYGLILVADLAMLSVVLGILIGVIFRWRA